MAVQRVTERFNYFRSAIDRSLGISPRMHTKYLPSFLPSFFAASLLLWIITNARFEFRFTFHPFATDSWEHLMNVFIVVRPSLCTEGSLESTVHDASRVVALFYVYFVVRLARRMISLAHNKSTVRRRDCVSGGFRVIITITIPQFARDRKTGKSMTLLRLWRISAWDGIFKRGILKLVFLHYSHVFSFIFANFSFAMLINCLLIAGSN